MRPRLRGLTSVQLAAKIAQSKYISGIRNITEMPTQTDPFDKLKPFMSRHLDISFIAQFPSISYQDGRVVKALGLSSNGRVVRVGSNPTPGTN